MTFYMGKNRDERLTDRVSGRLPGRLPARSFPRSVPGHVFSALGFLAVAVLALVGCGTSSNGALGVASFTLTSCGGSFSDVAGCDIKQLIATGGKVDLRARKLSDSTLLQLRSDFPAVISVTAAGSGNYTLSGLRPGMATIIAADSVGDVDHVLMQVDDAASISFLTVSAEGGTFNSQPSGDIDGIFVLHDQISKFTLLFAQIDAVGGKMLGRETFDTTLSDGLAFQSGVAPTVMQFDLVRPAKSGNYSLLIKHKIGPARYKMQITVP